MRVEIICVGTELLLGDILNTNARFLSQRMAELGFNLFSQSVVGDNPERLQAQLSASLSRSDLIILSGGLGPTEDDITKEITAKALGLPLVEDAESLQRIRDYFARTGRTMSESNKKQALTIKGATVLYNDHGTAPGYFVKNGDGGVVLLPGPPRELIPMFNEKVVPIISAYSDSTLVSHNVRLFGVGESLAAEVCGDMTKMSNPTVATYAKTGEVDIRVTASAPNAKKADELCEPILKQLDVLFESHIYGVDVEDLQHRVVQLLRDKNMKLATAESCTAGMLSGRITEVPGSSEVFEMGVTAYANYVKIQALGVDSEVINKKGAVSDEVAAQMAAGIRMMCGANIGVGITGVAGPGQSEGKPAGLVYVAIADEQRVYVRKIMGRGDDRDATRVLATSTALDMVRRYLQGCGDILDYGTPHGEPIKLMEGYAQPQGRYTAPAAIQRPAKPLNTEAIYSDEELGNLISTVENEQGDLLPEKLEIDDGAMSFVFDDDYSIENSTLSNTSSEEYVSHFDSDFDSEPKEDKPKKRGFLAGLLPWKGDPTSEKIRKTVFLIAFAVLIGTMAYLVNYFVVGWLNQQEISSAAEVWEDDDSMKKNADGIFIGFEGLLEQNPDTKAWIKIEGTNVNNPVYQTNNNDFYIDHDMNKQSSRYGALFIDDAARVGRDSNSQNLVIYGHHMRDGTMFGDLKNYTDLSFYKKHPIIDFTTLYRDGDYKIFAVFITNDLLSHDNGNRFNYRHPSFSGEEGFLSWIDEVKMRSIIDTGVDVQGDDEIITLSTCTYEFEEARLVVMARRVRDGETNVKDTSLARVNPNPLYPQIWYDIKGGKKPAQSSSDSSINADFITSDIMDFTTSDTVSDINDQTVTSGTPSTVVTPQNGNVTTSTPSVSTPAGPSVSSAPANPSQNEGSSSQTPATSSQNATASSPSSLDSTPQPTETSQPQTPDGE